MKNKGFLYTLVVLLAISTFSSCIKKEETWIDSMNGYPIIMPPAYVLRNQLVKLDASGTNWPKDVTYKWILVNFGETSSDTLIGNSVVLRFPDTCGSFSLTVMASCEGFFDLYGYSTTTVIDTSAETGSLTGRKFGDMTYTDPRDLHTYHTTVAGNLEWFAENLIYDDGISGCDYHRSDAIKYLIGRVYSWEEATGNVSATGLGNGPQGVCPPGWSVPTKEDWEDLGAAVNGGQPVDFYKTWKGLGEKVTVEAYMNGGKFWEYSPDHYHYNMFNWNGTPCGYSFNNNVKPENMNEYGLWWSSTEKSSDFAYYRYIFSQNPDFYVAYSDKNDFRMPVRCVRKIN